MSADPLLCCLRSDTVHSAQCDTTRHDTKQHHESITTDMISCKDGNLSLTLLSSSRPAVIRTNSPQGRAGQGGRETGLRHETELVNATRICILAGVC